MLNAIILGGDTEAGNYLRQVCADFADICIYKVLSGNARPHEVIQALNNYEPDVVFLDVSELESENSFAAACLRELMMKHPKVAVVPYCRRGLAAPLSDRTLPSLGPVLTPPFSAEDLEHATRIALRLRRFGAKRKSTVLAFQPSKPGAGATTVALHVASAAAVLHGKKSLLIEADLRSGSIACQLGLQTANPSLEAMENHWLTDERWSRYVDGKHGFDILPAWGGTHSAHGSRWDFYKLLRFARDRYDVIVVDLPEAIDEVAESTLAEADAFVMVAAPEIASLRMVRRRVLEMEGLGVPHAHMQLAVNRYVAGDGDPQELEELAKRAVSVVLPDDLQAIKSANRRRGMAASNSSFWHGVATYTGKLVGDGKAEGPSSPFGMLKKTIGNLFGASARDAAQIPARTRGGRIL